MRKRPFRQQTQIIVAIIGGVCLIIAAVVGGPLIGKLWDIYSQRVTPTVVANVTLAPSTLVQIIDFDYQDSPTKHGWTILQNEADETQLDIEHVSDSIVGSAISISSPVKYGMDFEVGLPASHFGRIVEFVAKLNEGAAVYAFVGLERDDGSITTGWVKFTVGRGQPKPVSVGTGSGEDEWQLFIEPIARKRGDWLLFRVNLEDAVTRTFGNDGWRFGQLKKFRIRGNLSLDYISIYEAQP